MKLGNKLFIAFSATTIITVALLLLIWQWGLQRAFLGFIEQAESKPIEKIEHRLIDFYARHKSWQTLRYNREAWKSLHRETRRGENRDKRHDRQKRAERGTEYSTDHYRRPPPLNDKGQRKSNNNPGTLKRLSLYDINKQVIIGRDSIAENPIIRPLHNRHNELIGYIGIVPERQLEDGPDQALLRQQLSLGLVTGLIALLFALTIAYRISRHFSQPIEKLRIATNEIKRGNLEWRLKINSGDEIQQLAEGVNALAKQLQHNNIQRQEWSSNIAHELRTPIAILQNQCEAMLDGVFELNNERIKLLLGETHRLQRLVEDLYQLSLAESDELHYQLTNLSVNTLVQNTVERFQSQCNESGFTLTYDQDPKQDPRILGDAERLTQVFDNLLQNSIRYTNSPGKIHLSIETQSPSVILTFQDSAPGVKAEERKQLFTRLYRVEKSRSREYGGSGLGLAICHAIIDAHEGSIVASDSSFGGLSIIITLPLTFGKKA